MATFPSFDSYGSYSSKNYGAHCLVFSLPDGREIFYSYKTPVAFRDKKGGLHVRVNDWSTTTGKHLNSIDGGCKVAKKGRIDGETFERMLALEFPA